jgi:hypothetical protein
MLMITGNLAAITLVIDVLSQHEIAAEAMPRRSNVGPMEIMMAQNSNATSRSGITGEVTIRPVRPHVTIGVPNSEPYQATIDVLNQKRESVTTLRTEADGTFRVPLPPGTYILRPQSSGLYPRASEQTVIVKAMSFTPIHITFDTGMR